MGRGIWSTYVRSQSTPSIHRLSPETLSQIFSYCVPEPDIDVWLNYVNIDRDGLARPSIHRAPVKLTHVCRCWREVALSHPELWTKLLLGARPTFGAERRMISPQRDAYALQVFAERAKTLPLFVALDYRTEGHRTIGNLDALTELSVLVPMILNLNQRLEGLRISLPVVFLSPTLFSLSNVDTYSMLKRMHISTHCSAHRPIVIDVARFPQLETLTLVGNSLRLHNSAPLRPTQLTDLVLEQCGPAMEIIECLSKPGLRPLSLTLSFSPAEIPSDPFVTLCSLSSVRKLHIEDVFTGQQAVLFFEQVNLPLLQELSITASRTLNDESWSSLVGWLADDQPPLQKLSIRGTSLTDGDFLECLDGLTELKELAADDYLFTSRIMHALRACDPRPQQVNGDMLCPGLTKITLYGCHSCSSVEVAEMIQSRFNCGPEFSDTGFFMAPLEHIHLIDCSEDLQSLASSHQIIRWIETRNLRVEVENMVRIPG